MSGSNAVVFTDAGPQPQSPQDLRDAIVAVATALQPGITTDLPGSLIEDVTSTQTAAVVVMDQARVDYINSVTPRLANPFLLTQLGAIYGVPVGQDTNTAVYVIFTGPPGFVIGPGFTVGDGTYRYAVTDGGVIGTAPVGSSTGSSEPILVVATQQGSWAVPGNTVNQVVTSVPIEVQPAVKVNNPLGGTPGLVGGETEESYRADVMRAGLASAQGTPSFLKTLLRQVTGVLTRLVAVRQLDSGGWEVIVGGTGDPIQIGYAILQSGYDISIVTGSVLQVSGITNANPGVITTDLNHGYVNGQVFQVNAATGLIGLNRQQLTATIIDEKTLSCGVDTTTMGTYSGNGFLTPNFRNVQTSIYDYPDTYVVNFVVPPPQTVTMNVLWNTSSTGFVSNATIAGAAQPALAAYVNSIPVGQPINQFELIQTFQTSTADLVPTALLTRLVFTVAIDGIGVPPEDGTGIIAGDPESYLTVALASISINQG